MGTSATAADAAAAAAAALNANGGNGGTTDEAAKAAADKATADAAAAAAIANETPEQRATREKAVADKAAADKIVADKAAADAAAVAAAANSVPDKYDLKLPDDFGGDKSVVERTAAIARELGLSNERAQKLLTSTLQEHASIEKSAIEATLQSHAKGGTVWEKQVEDWNKAALADELLAGNKPEQLTASVALAKQVLAKYGDKESIAFLDTNPIGSHPALLRLLVRIGKASSEGSLIVPGSQEPVAKEAKDWLYPKDKQTVQGSPD